MIAHGQVAQQNRKNRETAPAAPWWKTGVIYQVYPRSFSDSNGDGVGDIRGVIDRLDYLSSTLGVTAIWLSPFYPSPMADFGYDVSDYTDVDPLFGTLSDFDELIREAHARNLRIIVDYVPNHTSDQHPWFQESRRSRSDPKRDWYIWADAKPDGSVPNNWLSVFGGPAWTWDDATGQYYMHAFLKEQPDLNWRNLDVRKAMFDVVRFWLDRGVDGIRVDVAHGIMKDPELRDNPLHTMTDNPFKDLGAFDSQLHIHDRSHPDLHGVYRQLRRLLESYGTERERVTIGEIHIFDYREWATYFGENLDEFQLPFNFGLIGVKWTAGAVAKLIAEVEAALPPGAWPTYVVGNHDEHRVATRLGLAQARVAAMLLFTVRGTPTIYQGEEIGMTDVEIPPELANDPWGNNTPGLGLGRDAERSPMQWDMGPNSGFTAPEARPWLPLGEYATVNVVSELDDGSSMLNLYRMLLDLRRNSPALNQGSYTEIETPTTDCYLYERRSGDDQVMIALNFSDHEITLDWHEEWPKQIALSTHVDRTDLVGRDGLRLRGNEGVILAEPH